MRRTARLERYAKIARVGLACFYLLDSQDGQHRRLVELIAGLFHERVALLDQQPIALALLDLHQRPSAVELVAAKVEQELPLRDSLAPILERHPLAAVPHDDAARAIVAGRNDSLGVIVLDGVIFDFHG